MRDAANEWQGLVQQADGLHFLGGYSQTPEKTWGTHYLLANNRREWVALELYRTASPCGGWRGLKIVSSCLAALLALGFMPFSRRQIMYSSTSLNWQIVL